MAGTHRSGERAQGSTAPQSSEPSPDQPPPPGDGPTGPLDDGTNSRDDLAMTSDTILREDALRSAEDDLVNCCVDTSGERIDIDWIDPDTVPASDLEDQ